MNWIQKIVAKLNPAQELIAQDQGESQTSTEIHTVRQAYYKLDILNRGVNLTVDSAASITYDVGPKIRNTGVIQGRRPSPERLSKLLLFRPNPYQNAEVFRRELFLDLLLEGNIFIYWDGMHLFHLPSNKVEIIADKKTFVRSYKYDEVEFEPHEILHIKDNSVQSIFRGDSRLVSALPAVNTLKAMLDYQENFFKNNAIPGLILKTPNVLSARIKERKLKEWSEQYNPRKGGKRPAILDGDFDIKNLGHTDFRELDFKESIEIQEKKILKAIGVPPILLDSGNNANISPNLKMYYTNTILPLANKLASALEFFFGYDIKINTRNILALRPELKEEASYYTGLVNGGIMTPNEAREALRLEKLEDGISDSIRVPANIAGSAVDPTSGGRNNND